MLRLWLNEAPFFYIHKLVTQLEQRPNKSKLPATVSRFNLTMTKLIVAAHTDDDDDDVQRLVVVDYCDTFTSNSANGIFI